MTESHCLQVDLGRPDWNVPCTDCTAQDAQFRVCFAAVQRDVVGRWMVSSCGEMAEVGGGDDEERGMCR